MSVEEFRRLARGDAPPGLSGALQALLADASPEGAWVHAYLHRKERDVANAAYWYRRAGRPLPECSLDAEWAQIAGALLAGRPS